MPCAFVLQDALIKSLLEMVCIYYRKQAGIEEEEQEVEVRPEQTLQQELQQLLSLQQPSGSQPTNRSAHQTPDATADH